MKKKWTALFAAGLICLSPVSVTAETDSNAEAEAAYPEITENQKNVIAAGRVEGHAGDVILYPVYLFRNTGYSSTALRLYYDAALTPLRNDEDSPVTKRGEAGDDVLNSFSANFNKYLISRGTLALENEIDSGLMFTVQIRLPDSAAPGTLYEIKPEVTTWIDKDSNKVPYTVLDGWVRITAEPVEGDLNNDFMLTAADAVLLAKIIAEAAEPYELPQTEQLQTADFDADGMLTCLDIRQMLKRISDTQ